MLVRVYLKIERDIKLLAIFVYFLEANAQIIENSEI